MPNIIHALPIKGSPRSVFDAVSTPRGLDCWWSNKAAGTPAEGAELELQFGADYQWRCSVTKYEPHSEFEIEMTKSDDDWNGTRIGFAIEANDDATLLRFQHTGWPESNDHYQTSCYCWAMYLRCLKRYVEQGIVLPYTDRFNGG